MAKLEVGDVAPDFTLDAAGAPTLAARPGWPAALAYRGIARALLAQLDGRPKLRSGIMASLLGG